MCWGRFFFLVPHPVRTTAPRAIRGMSSGWLGNSRFVQSTFVRRVVLATQSGTGPSWGPEIRVMILRSGVERTMKIEIKRCRLEHHRSHWITIQRSLCWLVGFAMLLINSSCNRSGNVEIKTGAGNYCSVINQLVWTSNADSPAPSSGPAVTTFNIFIMDDMGGHRTRLTSDSWPVMNQHPVFTPDCQKIVWTHGGPDQSALWIMNADGSSKAQLLTPPADEADDHAWVGADNRIYFVRHRHPSGVHRIWRVNLDGSGPIEVVGGADKDRFHPNLRRDRKLVLYSAVPPGSLQGTEIRIFDLETKQDTLFYAPGWPVSAATWRPDGNAVIVAEKRNGMNPNTAAYASATLSLASLQFRRLIGQRNVASPNPRLRTSESTKHYRRSSYV